MGTKLVIVIACLGHHRLYNRIYRQDVTGTTWPHQAKEGGCAKKVDRGLISIGNLALQDRNVTQEGQFYTNWLSTTASCKMVPFIYLKSGLTF